MAIRVAGCARDGVVVAAGVVDAVGVRVAGCTGDGVVAGVVVVDAVGVRVAGCARDSVVVAVAIVVDAVEVTQEVELIQISITFVGQIKPVTIAAIECTMHLSKPRLSCLRFGG